MEYKDALHSYRIMAYMLPLSVSEKVVEALEKQIPKKPQIDKQTWGRNFIVYECPICNHWLDSKTQHNYCSNCGQAIDWGD